VNCLVKYPQVKPQVYPDPCSRVRVCVGSDIPYPDPDPPNPYPRTPGVSETPAQHYYNLQSFAVVHSRKPNRLKYTFTFNRSARPDCSTPRVCPSRGSGVMSGTVIDFSKIRL
jgi:hypothetical protein